MKNKNYEINFSTHTNNRRTLHKVVILFLVQNVEIIVDRMTMSDESALESG